MSSLNASNRALDADLTDLVKLKRLDIPVPKVQTPPSRRYLGTGLPCVMCTRDSAPPDAGRLGGVRLPSAAPHTLSANTTAIT